MKIKININNKFSIATHKSNKTKLLNEKETRKIIFLVHIDE